MHNKKQESQQPSAMLNPCDSLEELFEQHGWGFRRISNNELHFSVDGSWCPYELYFSWYEERALLYLSCQIDYSLPGDNISRFAPLLQELNAVMFMGHLEINPEYQSPVWRLGVPCRGLTNVPHGMLEDIIDNAIEECERIYPAFQLMLWGNHDARDAAANILFECHGHA